MRYNSSNEVEEIPSTASDHYNPKTMNYTKTQLNKMTVKEIWAIVEANWIFCHGRTKYDLVQGILEWQETK